MFKGLLFFAKFSWKHRKAYLLLNIINQTILGVLPLIIVLMPKYIIDELMGQQRLQFISVYVVVLLIAIFTNNFLGTYLSLKIFDQRCYLSAAFGEYIHKKLANTDFCNLEDPDFYDIKEKANKFLYGDWHGFAYVLESALSIIGKLFTAIGIIAIISTMSILLVILFLFMVLLSAFIDYKSKKQAYKYSLDATKIERRWNYFTRILEDSAYAKEIRINQISNWLIQAEKEHAYGAIDFYKKRNKCFIKSGLFNTTLNLIQNALTYIYLIIEVLNGVLSIGNFTMYVSAVASFSDTIRGILTNILDIKAYGVYYDALDKYVNIEETMRDNKKIPLSYTKEFRVEFKNVSFKYPGQDDYALKNVNVVLESGKKLSIVGENGSGKTTFIKLLCRLYDPIEGEILYNGINIKDIDYDQYMNLYATVFQDFKMFSFSIKDNIVWGNKSNLTSNRILDLLKEIGMDSKISSLPKGIDTIVYKEFDSEGFEPSGGEAQKIAIARAMAKDARIIVLDEPLSALDPKAEFEIFRKFDNLTNGKTAVYISHRLSTCRFCDEIAVFHNGRMIEYGTHDELIAKESKYKELYMLQAQYYQDTMDK